MRNNKTIRYSKNSLFLAKSTKGKIKQIAKKVLPPIVVDGIRWLRNHDTYKPSQCKVQSVEKVNWSLDYENRKKQLITKVISYKKLLEPFGKNEPLPSGYGVAIDERCVEYPWLFANLRDQPEILLDAGSTLNHEFILNSPLIKRKVTHILTLAPEENCFWKRGISYLFGDLRDIPIRDSYYDTIVCLSTLEHIGCDNTIYTQDARHRENHCEDFLLVMQEMCRVLKPGGTLLLTVPFGIYRHFGWFQQFDRKMLSSAVAAFGNVRGLTETFYRYTAEGWQLADAKNCAECEYVERTALLTKECHCGQAVEPDLAIAARAVVCVKLIKG
ncbi:MAG: class I SAM-dependent methyltransferase [Phycisphaerae bacterium]